MITQKLIDRFRSKIVKRRNGCHEWTGPFHRQGYGYFNRSNFCEFAHRFAYRLATGKHPGDLKVCHRCDNPKCVNPDHLFLGTQADNVRDMISKGRGYNKKPDQATVERLRSLKESGMRTQQSVAEELGVSVGVVRRAVRWGKQGMNNSRAILTDDQVREIRANYVPCKITRDSLAKRYGVSRPVIDKILGGRSWKHVV